MQYPAFFKRSLRHVQTFYARSFRFCELIVIVHKHYVFSSTCSYLLVAPLQHILASSPLGNITVNDGGSSLFSVVPSGST